MLQYVRKKASTKAVDLDWYNSKINSSKIIPFLKNERDKNIHEEPVKIATEMEISLQLKYVVSMSGVVTDSEGNIKQEIGQNETRAVKEEPSSVEIKRKFNDWAGEEDITFLCSKYLEELRQIISEGKSRGFLNEPS